MDLAFMENKMKIFAKYKTPLIWLFWTTVWFAKIIIEKIIANYPI